MKTIRKIISTIWQLPQAILGCILLLVYKPKYKFNEGLVTLSFVDGMSSGLSLGNYVFVTSRQYRKNVDPFSLTTVRHEIGHHKQSLYLGWLYLIVIGIPSLIWAMYHRISGGKYRDYFKFYTERWADNIAEIVRG